MNADALYWPTEWDTIEGFLAWCRRLNVKGTHKKGNICQTCLVARAVQKFLGDPDARCGSMTAGSNGDRRLITAGMKTAVTLFDTKCLPEFTEGRK